MSLAVIPARGGSKRIPQKNIKEFCGKPMIVWSIEAALTAHSISRVIVSTDNEEIAKIAVQSGAEVPFMRPPELSDDFTPTVPVIAHAIEQIENSGDVYEHVCCIYATAPFVEGQTIDQGLVRLKSSGSDFSFTAATYQFPVQRALTINQEGFIDMLYPEHVITRSQDLQETYHDAGQFYWGTRDAWKSHKPLMGSGSTAIILPRYQVQDIDTIEDWTMAELLFSTQRIKENR